MKTELGLDGWGKRVSTQRRRGAKAQWEITAGVAPLRLCAFALILFPLGLFAATNDLTSALQKGLFEEEANHNLEAAAAAYQNVSAQFDKDRKLAATAIFRLGEVYRKQGKTNEATAQYERIVREFSDQQTLATLSRLNLAGLSNVPAAANAALAAGAPDRQVDTALLKRIKALSPEEARRLLPTLAPDPLLTALLKEHQALELRRVEKAVNFGPNHPEMLSLEKQLQKLDEQIAGRVDGIIKALEMRVAAASVSENPGIVAEAAITTDDEEKEIRRIQALIQNSPDLINALRTTEGTPLCSAASKDQLRVAAFLLDHGADINLNGPLRRAAANGHKAMIQLLIRRGADVNGTDGEGQAALHLAAVNGSLSVTETLLKAKANPNLRDVSDQTPLTLAAKKNFLAVVGALLARGADPNVASKVHPGYGRNAVSEGRAMFGTPLHFAAAREDVALAELLLTNRADVKVRSIYDETPLEIAATLGKVKIAELLLNAGADVNASAAPKSATPLFLACSGGHREMVKLLLERGANPNVTALAGQSGVTPLMLAASQKDADLVGLLLKSKADPNAMDARGNTALLNAVFSRSPEVVRALLAAGANPDTKNEGGYPILMLSVTDAQNKEVAAALIEAKADVNAQDPNGKSPLHWAAQLNRKDFVEMLINAGAGVNLRDKSGMTPLNLAKGAQNQPQPAFIPVPSRPPTPPAGFGSFPKTDSPDIAALLREHGALDEFPDYSSIRLTRAGVEPTIVFRGDTNGINRFTVLEVIRNYYPKPEYVSRGRPGRSASEPLVQVQRDPTQLPFPDFSRIAITRRTGPKAGEHKEIQVNVLNSTNGFDLKKDVTLEFSDMVEIREREHALSESPIGLTEAEDSQLTEILSRKVIFVIKGQRTETVIPGLGNAAHLSQALQLDSVKRILRSSSDLSRLKIKRTNPKTKKTTEIMMDAQDFIAGKKPLFDDLWLRDGDVIEVPDKP